MSTLSSGFTFDGTTLTFTDTSKAPAAGVNSKSQAQKFTIAYNYHYGMETSYSFTKHANHRAGSTLSCHNSTQNNAVTCQHDSGTNMLSFTDNSQFSAGNTVVVTEQLTQQGNNFSLSGTGYLTDELVQLSMTGRGTCDIDSSFIVNDVVMLENMGVADCSLMQYLQPDTKQQVDYVYRVFQPDSEDFLQMDKSFFSAQYGKYKFEYWEVKVNDVRTNKFSIDDYRVVFDDEVEIGKNSRVKIKVYLYHAL